MAFEDDGIGKVMQRLSGLKTVMSECNFGVWKRRFPILKAMRTDLELSQKILVVTAVLFNIARSWNEEDQLSDDEETVLTMTIEFLLQPSEEDKF